MYLAMRLLTSLYSASDFVLQPPQFRGPTPSRSSRAGSGGLVTQHQASAARKQRRRVVKAVGRRQALRHFRRTGVNYLSKS